MTHEPTAEQLRLFIERIERLEDLDKIEKLPEVYEVHTRTFHGSILGMGKCLVSFAGAVMAMRLGFKPTENHWKNLDKARSISLKDRHKLYGLEQLSSGVIDAAFYWLDITFPQGLDHRHKITSYHTNPTQFKADMRDLADTLQGAGL